MQKEFLLSLITEIHINQVGNLTEYELKGVPVRIAIGQRDLENGTVEIARRDTLEKETVATTDVVARLKTFRRNSRQLFTKSY